MIAFANTRTGALLLIVFTLALTTVKSQPFPGVSTAGSSANAGAFSSSGTAIRPGPDGAGSFVAQSGFSQDFSNPAFRSAGAGSPTGYSGGYAGGSFSSTGAGFPFSFAPIPYPYFSPAQPFDFSSFFQNYIASIQRYHQQLAASAQKAAANEFVLNSQGDLAPQLPPSPDSFNNELGPVAGAAAFGQYGPQGGYGGAGVFPPPSGVDNRFGGQGPVAQSGGPLPPPGGSFYGVSSFSSSGQSDINGKKNSFKQSSVTINDNGKVTTYQAHDP